MPIRWTISHKQRRVVAIAEGVVTIKDVEDYLDAVVVADAQPYAKLFDATSMEAKVTDHDVMMLGARMRAYVETVPGGPLAVVVTTPMAREYIERFLNLAASTRPVLICGSAAEAGRWLDEQK